jgi:hypothetical protein
MMVVVTVTVTVVMMVVTVTVVMMVVTVTVVMMVVAVRSCGWDRAARRDYANKTYCCSDLP